MTRSRAYFRVAVGVLITHRGTRLTQSLDVLKQRGGHKVSLRRRCVTNVACFCLLVCVAHTRVGEALDHCSCCCVCLVCVAVSSTEIFACVAGILLDADDAAALQSAREAIRPTRLDST